MGRERYIWHYLFAGTRGAGSRLKIITALEKEPLNAHQLKGKLNMDYKTIRHHLSLLFKHRIVGTIDPKSYATPYFLTEYFISNKSLIESNWEKIKKGVSDI